MALLTLAMLAALLASPPAWAARKNNGKNAGKLAHQAVINPPTSAADANNIQVLNGSSNTTAAAVRKARPAGAGGKKATRLKTPRPGEPIELRILHPDGREQVVHGYRQRGARSSRPDSKQASAAMHAAQPGTPIRVIRLQVR